MDSSRDFSLFPILDPLTSSPSWRPRSLWSQRIQSRAYFVSADPKTVISTTGCFRTRTPLVAFDNTPLPICPSPHGYILHHSPNPFPPALTLSARATGAFGRVVQRATFHRGSASTHNLFRSLHWRFLQPSSTRYILVYLQNQTFCAPPLDFYVYKAQLTCLYSWSHPFMRTEMVLQRAPLFSPELRSNISAVYIESPCQRIVFQTPSSAPLHAAPH